MAVRPARASEHWGFFSSFLSFRPLGFAFAFAARFPPHQRPCPLLAAAAAAGEFFSFLFFSFLSGKVSKAKKSFRAKKP
jgi:hypothetical protein